MNFVFVQVIGYAMIALLSGINILLTIALRQQRELIKRLEKEEEDEEENNSDKKKAKKTK